MSKFITLTSKHDSHVINSKYIIRIDNKKESGSIVWIMSPKDDINLSLEVSESVDQILTMINN